MGELLPFRQISARHTHHFECGRPLVSRSEPYRGCRSADNKYKRSSWRPREFSGRLREARGPTSCESQPLPHQAETFVMAATAFVELLTGNLEPEPFVQRGLRLLESEFRERALFALAGWEQMGIPAPEWLELVPELF